MEEPADRAVVARADDQQIERGAEQGQLLGGVAVDGVPLDATERPELTPASQSAVASSERSPVQASTAAQPARDSAEPRS